MCISWKCVKRANYKKVSRNSTCIEWQVMRLRATRRLVRVFSARSIWLKPPSASLFFNAYFSPCEDDDLFSLLINKAILFPKSLPLAYFTFLDVLLPYESSVLPSYPSTFFYPSIETDWEIPFSTIHPSPILYPTVQRTHLYSDWPPGENTAHPP